MFEPRSVFWHKQVSCFFALPFSHCSHCSFSRPAWAVKNLNLPRTPRHPQFSHRTPSPACIGWAKDSSILKPTPVSSAGSGRFQKQSGSRHKRLTIFQPGYGGFCSARRRRGKCPPPCCVLCSMTWRRRKSIWRSASPTNSQPSQACLAIHVRIRRAGIWETNLAIASELLAGSPAIANPAAPRLDYSANQRAQPHHLDTGR